MSSFQLLGRRTCVGRQGQEYLVVVLTDRNVEILTGVAGFIFVGNVNLMLHELGNLRHLARPFRVNNMGLTNRPMTIAHMRSTALHSKSFSGSGLTCGMEIVLVHGDKFHDHETDHEVLPCVTGLTIILKTV